MKKLVKARITWLAYEEGGRKNPPPAGTRYCPIVIFSDMKNTHDELWSADFICTDVDDNNTSVVDFSFLAEDAPYEYLSIGNEFKLLEGNKKTAIGIII